MHNVELAERLKTLPPYLFAEIDRMKGKALAAGVDLIDLSVGDPDLPTPAHIIKAMNVAVERPDNHRYPTTWGIPSFREAVAHWYERRFGVTLDPASEVLSLIGSKEGIGHMPLAFINPGDVVLYSSPGYPVYPLGALFAGGVPHEMPILQENGYFPDYGAIPRDVLKKAKLLFINYPNNPTGTVATGEFFESTVALAKEHGVIVCHDAAYSEMYFGSERPMSFLETPGAKEVGMEFHSLSKTCNMTGWRLGFAVGNAAAVGGLGSIKSNLDSGVFQAVQEAGIAALSTGEDVLTALRNTYRERRDVLYEGLKGAGLELQKPSATFYLWAGVPEGYDSSAFTAHVLKEAGVLITPGSGFGAPGEGYVRFALTVPVQRTLEAVERIKKIL